MTREQKLALIIGFSLVMVVGVLISDHFSRARTDTLGSAVDQREGGGGSRIDPISLVQDEPPLDEAWVRDPLPSRTPQAQPAAHHAPDPAMEPAAIVMGEPLPATDPLGEPAGPASRHGFAAPPLTQQTPPSNPAHAEQARSTYDDQVGPMPISDPLSEMFEPVYTSGRDDRGQPMRVTPEPQPTLARERTHVVAEGESLWKIAERHYGDGSKWTKIRDRNPKLVDEDGIVRAGVKLAIPLEVAVAATAPEAGKPAGKPATTPTRPTSPSTPKADEKKPASKSRTYVVKRGDSLGEIAQRELGSARRWQEIVKLNGIEDPDHVPAGVTLRLPS